MIRTKYYCDVGGRCVTSGAGEKYSDTSANEDNSFRNHIR